MSSGKKTVLAMAAIAAVLAAAALAVLVILVSDEPPPPDDSDLAFVRPEVPAERNAWTCYAQALEKLKLPKSDQDADWPPAPAAPATPGGKPAEEAAKSEPGDPPPDVRERWNNIAWGNSWEQPLVDEVLKRNAEALALWEKGLAAPECLVPKVNDPREEISWIYSCLDVAKLASVRARNHARQGNDEAAMDEAMRLVRFGHHMEGGRGVLVAYLVGTTIKGMGLELMGDPACESRLSPDRLRRCAADMAQYQAVPQDIAATLRAEYLFGRYLLDKVASGEIDIEGLGFLASGGRRSLVSNLERLFFKPNRTRRLFAEMYRETIAAAPKHFAAVPDFDKFRKTAYEEQQWAGGNYTGGRLLWMVQSSVPGVLRIKCQTNVQVAATRVLLAMKAFKMEKGRLPATLDELVPVYLDAVPIDDFDGKPLRYNPAKKIIYTVGKDLRDDGGTTKQEFLDATMKERGIDPKTTDPEDVKNIEGEFPWQAPDPSYPIEF